MMTKTFKITIGILILLALAAGGVFSVNKNRIQREQNTEERMNNEETLETFKEAEGVGAEEVEEITIDKSIDTSNWKTYKNEEYGFELKYPGDFKLTTGTYGNKNLTLEIRKEVPENIKTTAWLNLKAYSDKSQLPNNENTKYNFETWIEKQAQAYGFEKQGITTIDNKKTYYGIVKGMIASHALFIDNEGKYFELTSSDIKFTDLEQTIIDTFRFLN